MRVRVSTSNFVEQQDSVLIKAYHALDQIDGSNERFADYLHFQSQIDEELVNRGWTYNENTGQWSED